ncbi:MAG TPA: lantibiotic dehydratase [Chitinophaga sp.]|uniref:lantibiotic dehydratase n=1 Tax=Chitinophaga sp. TaxID=1869181 RepID=UPI002CDFE99F|nr:lantibiotic dehydratase [Chitinophaga sp.]HVI43540.1 lantibiotic dehydratase [Chitinophaga sp.]
MALSHTGFFLLRTPLYPIGKYREVAREGLRELIAQNPLFSYALYIASRELVKELERYINDPSGFNDKKTEKLRKSLYKYWVRACTRSTPYGLFAGCTLGRIEENTDIVAGDMANAHQHIRLDMDYYTKVSNYIRQVPEVSASLTYSINNSLYKVGDKYRYAEYTIVNNRRKYLLTSIVDSVFIQKIVSECNGLTVAQLVQLIIEEDNTIMEEEAAAFIDELIASQILIPETEPRIIGDDSLSFLIDRLSTIDEAKALREELIALTNLFQQQDFEMNRLVDIHNRCTAAFPLELPKDLLQVDLFKKAEKCTLSEKLVNDILMQANNLLALCHAYTSSNSELSNFISRFSEQYESQEVPLNIALDSETGIGYGAAAENAFHAPFVEDVIAGGGPAAANTVNWSPVNQLALDKYEQFLREGAEVVSVTDEDLKKIGDAATVKFAESSYLFGNIVASSAEEAENGNYLFGLQSMGGPSAANLLGRFCSGDPQLAEEVKRILVDESTSYPGCIMAEIVHYPEARAGNVLIRPSLRDYEIPYVNVSGAAADHQLPVSDLMVSVRQGEVILRSKRLNKRIIPRLSSAHNYSFNSLPIYKFLCDLQHQSIKSGVYWDWGVLGNRDHLPRVQYNKMIISRATWVFRKKDAEGIKEDPVERIRYFDAYREKRKMPAHVIIAESDNELFLDLTQPASIQVLLDYSQKSDQVVLREFLFSETGGFIKDTAGNSYAHELLIPLAFKQASPRLLMVPSARTGEKNGLMRTFAPGSEWLYVKVYCGYAMSEELLASYFAEKLPEWEEAGLFDQFFFIRYADPKPHIRLRFLNANGRNNETILNLIHQDLHPYIVSGQIKKIQCDTYEREVERYRPSTMEKSEVVFYADSMAVLGILNLLDGVEGEMYRWKLAMRGVDILLDDFGLALEDKKALLASLRESFTEEFGGAKLLHKQLNDKYRKDQKSIASFMNCTDDETNEIEEVIGIYQQRSAMIATVASEIKELLQQENGSEKAHHDIIISYIHMFLNRIFVAKQRKHELVLYHFLEKYYLSQIALVELSK